jgi:hypothetical protein
MDTHKLLNQILFARHVHVVVAPEGNKEETKYWLARCVETKHKLIETQEDDDGYHYPIDTVIPLRHPKFKKIVIKKI